MTPHAAGAGGRFALGAALVIMLARGPLARAEDVTTLSGATYHDVQTVRVDPDGVTWQHATGIVKVDFTDLPAAVRKAFHYDAKQAAAFQAAQAQARQQFAAQMQQTQREAEAHRVQQFQQQTAAGAGNRPGEFVYRRGAAEATATQSVGEGIAAKTLEESLRTKDDGTIWDRRLWTVPVFLFGGDAFHGMAFDPHTDLNSHEFQHSIDHEPGAFAPTSAHDPFFQPIYMTKSYYDDVERAEAFARGKP